MKFRPPAVSQPHLKIIPPIVDEHLLNDDFLAELDIAFDSIKMSSRTKKKPIKKVRSAKTLKKTKKAQMDMVHHTFISMCQNHFRPMARYLKAIELGVTSRDLCKVMHYIVEPMVQKTKKVQLGDHAQALNVFDKTLVQLSNEKTKKVSEEEGRLLKSAYANVEKLFELNMRGHSTAVVNVLAFYKAIKKNKRIQEENIKRLFAIGIPSMSMLRKTSIQELSSLSGIPNQEAAELRRIAREFNLFDLV